MSVTCEKCGANISWENEDHDCERVANLMRDAARYRWLRTQEGVSIELDNTAWSGGFFPVDFDTFIDEAMRPSALEGSE